VRDPAVCVGGERLHELVVHCLKFYQCG